MEDSTLALPAPKETLLQRIEGLPSKLEQMLIANGHAPELAADAKQILEAGADGLTTVANVAITASEAAWPPFLIPFAPLVISTVDAEVEKLKAEAEAKAAAWAAKPPVPA